MQYMPRTRKLRNVQTSTGEGRRMNLLSTLRPYLPVERRRRTEALKRLTMEQRMQDWGRQVEVDGRAVSAWRAGREAPSQVPSWEHRPRR